ncbi:MAG: hypothetical protein ACLUGJ_01230 [Blautia wexlerae]
MVTWELIEDGKPIQSGEFTDDQLNIAPLTETVLGNSIYRAGIKNWF